MPGWWPAGSKTVDTFPSKHSLMSLRAIVLAFYEHEDPGGVKRGALVDEATQAARAGLSGSVVFDHSAGGAAASASDGGSSGAGEVSFLSDGGMGGAQALLGLPTSAAGASAPSVAVSATSVSAGGVGGAGMRAAIAAIAARPAAASSSSAS